MKYTMSMAADKNHLKTMIMEDEEMTVMEKLHDIFAVEKEALKRQFPELYDLIIEVTEGKYCIIYKSFQSGTWYLAWGENGYFWTDENNFKEIISCSTPEHHSLFNSEEEANTFLQNHNLYPGSKVVKWVE